MAAKYSYGINFLGSVVDPSAQPNRICCLSKNIAAVVNGRNFTIVQSNEEECRDNAYVPDDGNVVKAPGQTVNVLQTIPAVSLRPRCADSFQSCCSSGRVIYAVDSGGGISIIRNSVETGDWKAHSIRSGAGIFSGGWAGLALYNDSAIIAHYMSKSLHWVDMQQGVVTRSSLSVHNPTSVTSLSGSSELNGSFALTEGNSMSVWDARISENSGCVLKNSSNHGLLWTSLFLGGYDVLTAGSDKTIQIYDSRNWRLKLKWRTPCKYDVVKLLPACDTTRSRSVYVCGLDNEILLCDVSTAEQKNQNNADRIEKRKHDEISLSDDLLGPSHAILPESSKLRITHHR